MYTEKADRNAVYKTHKFFNRECKKGRSLFFLSVLSATLISLTAGIAGCGRSEDPSEHVGSDSYDLTVFTAQEPEEWEPVVKEFEERTGWNVKVETGSAKEMLSQLEKEEADWDVAFGVSVDALETGKDSWQIYNENAWTGYSAVSFVILYNTNVVTYRELPSDWDSLLEPRWKGRVAVPDPFKSDLGAAVLAEAAKNSSKENFLDLLAENMEYQMPQTFKEAEQGISDGRYSIGVASKEAARALLAAGRDVDYIDLEEGDCFFEDGTAIRKGTMKMEVAEKFVTYTTCEDTKWLLRTQLLRQPAEDADLRVHASDEDLKERFSGQQEVFSIWKIIMDEKSSAAKEQEQ